MALYAASGYVASGYASGGGVILSEPIAATGDVSMADFMNILNAGHAPTYTPFRSFIVGDYDYRTALFRTVMHTDGGLDKISIKELRVTVDVPDVYDRGTATVIDATSGLRVNFNRSFHAAPEVTVTMTSGASFFIPRVVADDGGFQLHLKDLAGNFVTGTVSWNAAGY